METIIDFVIFFIGCLSILLSITCSSFFVLIYFHKIIGNILKKENQDDYEDYKRDIERYNSLSPYTKTIVTFISIIFILLTAMIGYLIFGLY